jgi:hypothetical protein
MVGTKSHWFAVLSHLGFPSQWGVTQKATETTGSDLFWWFFVYHTLVIGVDLILFLREFVVFQRDDKVMCWLWRRLQEFPFGFMNSLDQVEFVVPTLSLLLGTWIESSGLLSVVMSSNVLIEAVDGLPLVFGWLKLC